MSTRNYTVREVGERERERNEITGFLKEDAKFIGFRFRRFDTSGGSSISTNYSVSSLRESIGLFLKVNEKEDQTYPLPPLPLLIFPLVPTPLCELSFFSADLIKSFFNFLSLAKANETKFPFFVRI